MGGIWGCVDLFKVRDRLIVGETVLGELRQVLLRKLRWPAAMANELEVFLREHSMVIAKSQALDFRELNQDDLKVLGESVAGESDVLVTGDQDLLPDRSFLSALVVRNKIIFF